MTNVIPLKKSQVETEWTVHDIRDYRRQLSTSEKALEARARRAATRVSGGLSDEFHWATGPQSPVLLHHLMNAIDSACRPEAQSKPRAAIRLVDRKPLGSA